MAEPPTLLGGAQVSVALVADAGLATTLVGALGTAAGETVTVTEVAGPVPWLLIAATDNVYVDPAVRFRNVFDRAVAATVPDQPVPPAVPPSREPGYPVMAEPPLLDGGAQFRVAVVEEAGCAATL